LYLCSNANEISSVCIFFPKHTSVQLRTLLFTNPLYATYFTQTERKAESKMWGERFDTKKIDKEKLKLARQHMFFPNNSDQERKFL
jgi:hypothetical protein